MTLKKHIHPKKKAKFDEKAGLQSLINPKLEKMTGPLLVDDMSHEYVVQVQLVINNKFSTCMVQFI